jgi:hypothetical protein
LGSPQASGGVRIPLRGDAAAGHGDPSERLHRPPSPDLLCCSACLSSGASVGHVSHPISTGLCPATPVAAPTHLYYPAGTVAPGPVLTSLPSHSDTDRHLHRHGMDRGILSNVPHLQTHSDVQDQAGGNLKLALLLATYIVYLLRPQVIKLWRRLRGRRRRHDTPILELPRLRREP